MRLATLLTPALGTLITLSAGCTDTTQPTPVTSSPPAPRVPPGSAPQFYSPRYIYVGSALGQSSDHQQRALAPGFSPVWSPDGRKIAFEDGHDGNVAIHVVNVDGSAKTRLTGSNGDARRPRWSPDGTRIAFTTVYDNPFPTCQDPPSRWHCFGEISVINADGSNQVPLTRDAFLAGWSRDGSKIAFVSGREGGTELYVINADGTNPTQLTQLRTVNGADWSPDGRRIALRAAGGVYVVDADGSNLTQLLNADGFLVVQSVTWSPGGDKIAFDVAVPGVDPNFLDDDNLKDASIQVINADGTNRITLATNARDPRWLPDGRTLSFLPYSPAMAKGVWIVPADGGEPSLVLPDSYDAAWSPDGARVASVKEH